MKTPTYITKQQKQKTLTLFKKITKLDSIKIALIFKRLALTAAYGEMIQGKINYDTFLYYIEQYIKTKNTIIGFWDIAQPTNLCYNNNVNTKYKVKTYYIIHSYKKTEQNIIDNCIYDTQIISPYYKHYLKNMFKYITI